MEEVGEELHVRSPLLFIPGLTLLHLLLSYSMVFLE